MVDYREILRLQSLGYNITQIAGSLRSSRNTVREVERLADEKWNPVAAWRESNQSHSFMFCFIRNDRKKQMFIWNRTVPGSTANWRKKE